MYLHVRHWASSERELKTLGELIGYEVGAVDSERGRLEDLEEQVNKLGEFVAAIANELPAHKQKQIVRELCRHWHLVE